MLATVLVVAGVAVYGIYRLRNGEFRWDVFGATFARLNPAWFSAAAALIFGAYLVRAVRWRVMLRAQTPHPSLWRIFTATCIGFTAVTLFGRPGELVRPYLIAVREKVSFSSQVAAWVVERIYDLMMVLLLFGFALSHMPSDLSRVGPAIQWTMRAGGWVAAVIGLLCVAILVASSRFSGTTRQRLTDALAFLPPKPHAKATEVVHAFTQGMACSSGVKQMTALFGWSIVEWVLITASTLALFKGLPATRALGWLETCIFIGLAAFGAVVQVPGIGGGLQVAAIVILTQLFGLSLEPATGVAILVWFLSFVLIVPIGLVLMFTEGVKLKALREMASKELEEEPAAK